MDWRLRLDYAGQLLHKALNMADLPAEVSCAAMLSENVLIDLAEERIRLRFRVVPLEDMDGRELAWLTGDQLKKILRPTAGSPVELLDFLEELEQGCQESVVRMYRLWRARYETLWAAHEALEEKNVFQRWQTLVWRRLKRRMTAGKRRRAG